MAVKYCHDPSHSWMNNQFHYFPSNDLKSLIHGIQHGSRNLKPPTTQCLLYCMLKWMCHFPNPIVVGTLSFGIAKNPFSFAQLCHWMIDQGQICKNRIPFVVSSAVRFRLLFNSILTHRNSINVDGRVSHRCPVFTRRVTFICRKTYGNFSQASSN